MRTRSKLALIGLGATILMAFALSTASARNFSASSQNFKAAFNNLEFEASGVTTTCHVTLEGTLHSRTIAKVANQLIGNVTRVATAACSTPVTILNETLPWNVRYIGFSGNLPNITLILVRVTRPRFLVEPAIFGFRCLSVGDIITRFVRNTSTGQLTEAEVPLQNVETVSGGGTGCPVSSARFRSGGNGAVETGAGTRVTITLI